MINPNENRTPAWFTPTRFGILLALLIFAAFPQVLLGMETFVVRDYGFFVYPLAHFQRDCFWHGKLPFWNPYNNCGVPFLAQWNTMPLYPPSLVYLIAPLTWGLGFFSLLHLWWAGMGMYFLARRWTGNPFAGAFAGLVFGFNGFSLNLLMWPSHMATLSWMPWVLLAVEPAWREGGRKIFVASIVGALQMLAGGPEIIFMTWVIAAALWLQQLIGSKNSRFSMLWRLPSVVALVIALSAAQLLPFLDLVHHAQRASGFADLRWSMPGSGWANFLVPMAFGGTHTEGIFFQQGQNWTSSYYLGIATLLLAGVALITTQPAEGTKSKKWLLAVIAITGLILALGQNTPVLPALRHLIPQLSMITYPVKYICVAIFALPLMAAFALSQVGKLQKKIIIAGSVLFILIAAITVWTQTASSPGEDMHAAMLNGITRAAFLLLIGGILFALTLGEDSRFARIMPLLLLLVVWTDVYTHEPPQNPTAQPWIFQENLTRQKLAMNPQPELGQSRAMVSPGAAINLITMSLKKPQDNYLAKRLGYCANCNLLDGVPKVDGFLSLSPAESDEIQSLFYTTTNASYPGLENFMGVSQITAPDEVFHWQARTNYLPLVTAGQKPFFLDDATALSALTQPDFDGAEVVLLPKSAASLVTVTNQTQAHVVTSTFGINAVDATVEAGNPSLIVIAQSYYHNWQAQVDGQTVPLWRANVGFQAVQVPAGRHQIHLNYHDQAFVTGGIVSGLAWLISLGGMLAAGLRPKIS